MWCVPVAAILAGACRQDMHDQPRFESYEASTFFADGMSARQPVPDTVARGQLHADPAIDRGKGPDGKDVVEIPVAVTAEGMARGRERYDIYCSPCHGRVGTGRGMVVLRGFKPPPSFHEDRLRGAPAGHFFDVMTNGFGAMSSYAPSISVEDRWAIVAYVRALQESQHAAVAELPTSIRDELGRSAP
ncbi:MAG: cytochrome c [Acidobacteriota bacterium]